MASRVFPAIEPVVNGLAVGLRRFASGVALATSLGSTVLAGAIAIPLSQMVVMPGAIAQTTFQERVISTSGRGAVAIPVTHAQITVGIEIQGKDAATVQGTLAAQANTLVKWLEGQDIEELQTQGISLTPRYDRRSTLTGYVGRTMLAFRAELDDSGSLIDGAVRNGATRINNIALTASPDAIRAAHREALKLAAQSAQDEADVVLAALGLTRKEVIGIQLQGSPAPHMATRGAMLEAGSAPPMPVVGGEQTVNAFVSLQIRY